MNNIWEYVRLSMNLKEPDNPWIPILEEEEGMPCPPQDAARGGLVQEPTEEDEAPISTPPNHELESFWMPGPPSGPSSLPPSAPTHSGPIGITGKPVTIQIPDEAPIIPSTEHKQEVSRSSQGPTSPVSPQTIKRLPSKIQGQLENHNKPSDEEILKKAKDEKKRIMQQKHAKASRQRKKQIMEELEKKNKELEAKHGINKKIICMLWKKIHNSYPKFMPHSMQWFSTADGRDEPIQFSVLLPDTSPEFLNELGNNPGNGHLCYSKRTGDDIEVESGSASYKKLKIEEGVWSSSSQENEGSPELNLPKFDALESDTYFESFTEKLPIIDVSSEDFN